MSANKKKLWLSLGIAVTLSLLALGAGYLGWQGYLDSAPQGSGKQAQVVMYSLPDCPYCIRAKGLLQQKDVIVTEIDITVEPEQWDDLLKHRPELRTVPQIFIDGQYIGGADALFALEAQGQLDGLLHPP